jgi:hypothetical protein
MFRSPMGKLAMYAMTGAAAVAALGGAAMAADDTATATTRGEVAAPDGAELRQAPADDSPALTTADRGDEVAVLCVAEGERRSAWYLVHTDYYAWAAADDIELAGDEPSWC